MNEILLTENENDKNLFKKMITQTVDAICEVFKNNDAYAGKTPDELKSLIFDSSILNEKGLGWEKTFEQIKEKIIPNLLQTSSSNYMAHLHGPALLETIACELIISAFNQSMDSWDQSPIATEIEVQVIQELCKLYGYDEKLGDGVFTSGGSQSNQTAIILARDWFCNKVLHHDVRKLGLPNNFNKMRMYTSEISHFSMEKSAHILGLGFDCVVKVPVDSQKKMDISALKSLIEDDKKNGNIPFLVVATVGTTDFGSIDNLSEISKIAKLNNMYFHADAAYGSGVIMAEKYKERVFGLDLCDSITVDFHKMFLMPISCSAVLIKNKENFDFLTIHADYLNRKEDEEDGYTNLVDKSLQTTRRFDALKVWASFKLHGKSGWSKLIEKSMDNAQYFYELLKNDINFEVATKPEISSVVFRLIGIRNCDEVNKNIRRKLIHNYGIVIGQTVNHGNVFLKFTLLNPKIDFEKLEELKELIKTIGQEA